ncbi:MAG: protoglobin domain-containing protein [Proteobacteria bacterium]|nr:protoglobin domain-containing protein [Pseudomonadota bacterium]
MPVATVEVLYQLASYVGFTKDDQELLCAMGPVVEPHFNDIVERFYLEVRRQPATAAIVSEPQQIERLKGALRSWLKTLFAGTYDEAYFEKRARIGRTHVRIQLEQRFMFSAMNVVRRGLHEGLRRVDWPRDRAERGHDALDKICDIELGIMLETYREDYVLRRTAESEIMAAMGRLTAGLAHEIRNPLNAAKLQLELMRRTARGLTDGSDREQIGKRVDIVNGELERLSALLDDFLSLARPHAIESHALDLSQLIVEIAALQAPAVEDKGVTLLHRPGRDLPKVQADPARIKQVLLNLITNAVEATQGRADARVEVSAHTLDDGYVEVWVRDNGTGIEPEVMDRVFQSFVTTKDAGTGLGLTIVKSIIDRHGGSIRLEPAADCGVLARFTLPTARTRHASVL